MPWYAWIGLVVVLGGLLAAVLVYRARRAQASINAVQARDAAGKPLLVGNSGEVVIEFIRQGG